MKKVLKGITKAMPVIFFAALTAYLAFTHTKNWQTIVTVAIVLFVLIQLFYKPFHVIKIGDQYSLEFDGSAEKPGVKNDSELQNKVDKLNQRLTKAETKNRYLQDQINGINKKIAVLNEKTPETPNLTYQIISTAESLETFYFTNDLDKFDKTSTPISVEAFHNTIEEAKKNNEPFKENHFYKSIVDKYSEAFAYALIQKVSPICDAETLQKIEPTLYGAVKRPYSKATILAIRDELIKDGNKAELTLAFEQFIKELDMLY